ncbi:N-6 DNA methylase [uncultured Bacteroides sp.]|uniref:HsdM family class I SAM-dependent methyltransferase n=2 Tax=uncultured Bacteroides sp. TaxID=162156 RepID=UPI0025916D99|nr:N-6 DNA methylase [uncultured Bacteroides sp.]
MGLQEIYDKLSFTDDSLIRLSDNDWKKKVVLPSRVCRLLEENEFLRTLDAFFCFDNKPLILFFKDPLDNKALHQAIWNFNESPIVIIVENNVVEIFNGFAIDENKQLLKRLGGNETLNDFTYFELVTGKTWEKYNDDISYKNRVDYRLLENIEAVQKLLKEKGLTQTTANALLGKIIFFRYLIDRHVRLNYQEKELWSNDDLCNCLSNRNEFIAFIRHIENKDTGFNGDMFHISESEFDTIGQDALNVLIRLLRSDEISTGQQSLFNIYDFSILPIEFISNIYEKFIGKENQETEGAYYTPTFLVDYIVSETIGKKLKESNDYNCKVLDPACGSGIFLVESLRKIIEKYIAINEITDTNTDDFRQTLKSIAQENIFGIDKDPSAIQVAIFSVYLTLLDYQKPADIGSFKFPNLLGTNFICSDTFDLDNKDLKALEDRKLYFDYIIGNPPWKGSGGDEVARKYIKERKKEERDKKYCIQVNNNELAEYFVFRASDFCQKETEVALVIHSMSLYNLNSKDGYSPFRQYLLEEFHIKKIFELAAVRKEVFEKSNDKAVAPACVLFYKYAKGENTNNNVITHISLKPSRFFSIFKVLSVCSNDIQEVQQDRLKNYDWLWKVLVYGSYLDFNLIKRLKEKPSIKSIIADDNRFISATGITFSKEKAKYDASGLRGMDFVDAYGVENFFINPQKVTPFQKDRLGRIRNTKKDIFCAPMLLCRHGLDTKKLIFKSAISYKDVIFKKSLLSIKAYREGDTNILKNIACIFASDISSYLSIQTFSSVGIERENAKEFEILSLPYVALDKDYYETLEGLYKLRDQKEKSMLLNANELYNIDKTIEDESNACNSNIKNTLNLTVVDDDIVDYALNVSRTIIHINSAGIKKKKELMHNCPLFKALNAKDTILKDYAQVYIDRFANSFNRNGKRFTVEILYSKQVIGMYFKVIDENMFINDIVYTSDNEDLLPTIIALTSQKLTDALFVQKDVRGFEKEYFYIFKPNEKRLWHKAIAYLDVNEFDDAMLRVGRDGE